MQNSKLIDNKFKKPSDRNLKVFYLTNYLTYNTYIKNRAKLVVFLKKIFNFVKINSIIN